MVDLTKYMKHLPTCNIEQDWTEAWQAMADTPAMYRDPDYDQAYEDLKHKATTCTCGLEKALEELKEDRKEITAILWAAQRLYADLNQKKALHGIEEIQWQRLQKYLLNII